MMTIPRTTLAALAVAAAALTATTMLVSGDASANFLGLRPARIMGGFFGHHLLGHGPVVVRPTRGWGHGFGGNHGWGHHRERVRQHDWHQWRLPAIYGFGGCSLEHKWRTVYVPGVGLERYIVKVCGTA